MAWNNIAPGVLQLDDTPIEIWYAHLNSINSPEEKERRYLEANKPFEVWLSWDLLYATDTLAEAKKLAMSLGHALDEMKLLTS